MSGSTRRFHDGAIVVAGWLGGSLMTALVLVSMNASADGSAYTDDLPRLVPYQGHIARGGEGFNGTLDLTFDLYEASSGGDSVFTEQHTDVNVYQGQFSVLLGSTATAKATALQTLFEDAEPLYVGVTLDTSSGTVALEGRKAILPVPHAVVATGMVGDQNGSPLTIAGNSATSDNASGPLAIHDGYDTKLAMDGDEVEAGGVLYLNYHSAQAVHVHGDLTLGGSNLSMRGGTNVMSLTSEAGFLSLHANSTKELLMYGEVDVNGDWDDTSPGYAAEVSNVTFDNCTDINLQDTDGSSLLYEFCPDGKVVREVTFQDRIGSNAKAIEVISCCDIDFDIE